MRWTTGKFHNKSQAFRFGRNSVPGSLSLLILFRYHLWLLQRWLNSSKPYSCQVIFTCTIKSKGWRCEPNPVISMKNLDKLNMCSRIKQEHLHAMLCVSESFRLELSLMEQIKFQLKKRMRMVSYFWTLSKRTMFAL